MTELGQDERAQLLDRMRGLIARWGHESWVAAPIVEPSDRGFPDAYTPDLRGVRTVMRRLLTYAGLGGLEVDVEGQARPGLDRLAETVCVVAGLDERGVDLHVYAEGPAEDVPLTLAHEAARIYRELRSGPVQHPYRAPAFEDAEAIPDEELEEEVSLTACYLGFGLLVAKGAHVYRAEGEMTGYVAVTRWVHRCLGALAPDEACFLLAAQLVARDVEAERLARYRAHLGPNEARWLDGFVTELSGDRDALLDALGLPPPDGWPDEETAPPEPLVDDGWRPPTPPPPERAVNAGRPVLRRRQHRGWSLATSAGFLSIFGFVAALISGASTVIRAALFVLPVLTVAAYFLGKRVRRGDICSHCETPLRAASEVCPGCGGAIRGAIGPDESHLAALERMRDVATFSGAIAGDQADADPRYVERGVKCPCCAWIPDGAHHWQCHACEGEAFNTFEHGGQCPRCEEVFDDTLCPRCDHMSPYDWWWPAED